MPQGHTKPLDTANCSASADHSQSLTKTGALHGYLSLKIKICYYSVLNFLAIRKTTQQSCANFPSPVLGRQLKYGNAVHLRTFGRTAIKTHRALH